MVLRSAYNLKSFRDFHLDDRFQFTLGIPIEAQFGLAKCNSSRSAYGTAHARVRSGRVGRHMYG
eukprot:3795509-Rhodomonas_salina.2